MAATVATLRAVRQPGFHAAIAARDERLMEGLRRAFADTGVPAVVAGFGTVFHVAIGLESPARSWRDLLAVDRPRYVAFATTLLRRGVRVLEPGAWFLSSEHDGSIIQQSLEAIGPAAREV